MAPVVHSDCSIKGNLVAPLTSDIGFFGASMIKIVTDSTRSTSVKGQFALLNFGREK